MLRVSVRSLVFFQIDGGVFLAYSTAPQTDACLSSELLMLMHAKHLATKPLLLQIACIQERALASGQAGVAAPHCMAVFQHGHCLSAKLPLIDCPLQTAGLPYAVCTCHKVLMSHESCNFI